MNASLDLTPEERALLQRWRGQSEKAFAYFAYYGAILLPIVAFATYGLLKRDVIALAVAFAGLLLHQIHRIVTDLSRSALYRSLANKIAIASSTP
jgi:hypothetical protein